MRALVNAFLLCLFLASTASAADLYRITVTSPVDAERFGKLELEPIARLLDGYLVLTDAKTAADLTAEAGAELIARDISRSELAFDLRKDRLNVGKYSLLFEEDAVRLYRVPANLLSASRSQLDLGAVPTKRLKIEYVTSRRIIPAEVAAGISLDSLIGLVSQDSLSVWTYRLQAYLERVTGTDSNFAAQQWTRGKFLSFGYDSVYYDTFTTDIYGVPEVVRNVVAVKVGSQYPNRYIVVGGHQDGVPDSPGADDNASGTVGTLEIARILANIETKLTFVFIAFDGEEQGLHGSNHYADAAGARGDSILFMLNMDMIAHYDNTNLADLYSGPDLTYVTLWQDLADSLVGLTGSFAGVANNSDHAGFVNNGYPAVFVSESIFSTKYHSSADSTTYMSFPYFTKMVKASLATAYVALLDATTPGFNFVYSPPIPAFVYAGADTTIQLSLVSKNSAAPVSGSGRLNYSINSGTFQQEPLTELSPTSYEFILPALTCDDTLRYFITLEEVSIGLLSDGSASMPYSPRTITEVTVSFADNFETNLGWTPEGLGATAGYWQRGVPVADPTWNYTPLTDADGSGSCYLTQNTMGNSDVDNGAVRLTSPSFSLTGSGEISYYYFLTVTDIVGAVDRLLVEVNNGQSGNWYQVALYTTDTFKEWRRETVSSEQITELGLALTSNMKIRFTANDANTQSVVEAGIDGFNVTTFRCEQGPSYVCGDADANLVVDIADAVYLITYIFKGGPAPSPPVAGDTNCDTIVDIADAVYLITYIFKSGPAPCAACE